MARPWPFGPRPKHALPDPWWRRPYLWAGGAVALALLIVVVLSVGGGGGGDPFVEPSFNTTSTLDTTSSTRRPTTTSSSTTATVPTPECAVVANTALLMTIGAEEAWAIELDDGWFVAKANGATWYTTADVSREAEGELVPMNDQARADSESRRDLPPGDPLYNGHTDAEPLAEAARACAATN